MGINVTRIPNAIKQVVDKGPGIRLPLVDRSEPNALSWDPRASLRYLLCYNCDFHNSVFNNADIQYIRYNIRTVCLCFVLIWQYCEVTVDACN